jgi:hypothetical protein
MKKFLNEKEMAQRLGVSVAWLRKRRITGGGPVFCKMGRLVRYPDDSADVFAIGLPRLTSTSMCEAEK